MKYSIRNFFITFLISLVLFGAAVLLIFGYFKNDLNNMLGAQPDIDQTSVDTDEASAKSSLSFLLIGRDTDGKADTLTLIKLDKAKKRYVCISVPTDMQLEINNKVQTLKQASGSKDVEYLKKKTAALTGIEVDYFIDITYDNAVKILELLGEFTYKVPRDIQSDSSPKLNIGAGEQKLDAKTSVDMLSYVGYKDGDKTRTSIVRDYLETLFSTFLVSERKAETTAESLSEIYSLVSTDFSINNFMTNIDMIFGYPGYKKTSLGYSGTYKKGDDGEVICVPDIAESIQNFEDYR
ncbi:MAG: LCP family protein [Firmicutes bacterium]|nr:LCP family protein [Bacillota bacterium]